MDALSVRGLIAFKRCIILEMANLPAPPNKSSQPTLDPKRAKIASLLAGGVSHKTIARKLAKGDPKKAKVWREKLRRWMMTDEAFQQAVAAGAMAELRLAVPATTQALIDVATKRKRVDAIKLTFEASGFHNPRVQHEHSGEIQVSLNIPRPGKQEALNPGKDAESPVVDAEVVDD